MKTRIVLAALMGGALLVPPAAAEPPTVFVNLLFTKYKTMDQWAKSYDPCTEYCEAGFAKLVKAARKNGTLRYDPICQCDKGGDKFMMFTGATGATDSDYLATMKKMGKPGTWVLKLHWVEGDWKIQDIVETINGKPTSLRQRLGG